MKKKIVELAGPPSSYNKPAPKKPYIEEMEELAVDMLLDLQNLKLTQGKRGREFRTSSLPFCPILSFLKDAGEESYSKSHFTSTGTAIHETVQSWLSVSKISKDIIWGSWKCTGCGAIKLNQFRPRKECDCNFKLSTTQFHRGWPKHWTYHEFEYNYKGLTGHIDLIVWPRPDFAFVLDIKTTEVEKKRLRWNWKQDKISSPNYVAQVRTYATILDIVHGIPIKSWMLSNLERARPINKRQDFHPQVASWSRKHSEKWMKHLDLSIKNNKILTKVEAAIDAEDRDEAERHIKRMIVSRPCTDQTTYDNYMRYGFYTGECEHCNACFSGDRAVRKMITTELAKKE